MASVIVRFHFPMKNKSVALLFALFTTILGLTAGLFAADKAAARPAVKKPSLKIDASPVGDTETKGWALSSVLDRLFSSVSADLRGFSQYVIAY